MKAIRKFTVRPVLPESLAALDTLASNYRWSWHPATQTLFRTIAPECDHGEHFSPVRILGQLSQERLEELAADPLFVDQVAQTATNLQAYLTEPRWYQRLDDEAGGPGLPQSIAYFSPEFGVDGSLPQYSGGLGILAGDHLKSASDLGIPLIGVGLFYKQGYFHQSISNDGWQQESYPLLDPSGLGLSLVRLSDGSPAEVALALPDGQTLFARIWRAQIGRTPLLLLDTDTPTNSDELRLITDRLYGGGSEHRLRQELLLGVGGLRAIRLWCELSGTPQPEVYHTNEGHAGFQGLERMSEYLRTGLDFATALTQVRASTVFTTHTPVPAGIDRFERGLVEHYLTEQLLPGLDIGRAIDLGLERYEGGNPDTFNMAVMGLHLADTANGVSKLHGIVSREMFRPLWPNFDADEVPITSITNGVHAPTWVAPALIDLAEDKYGTPRTSEMDWTDPERVSDIELWGTRLAMKADLVTEARRRVKSSYQGTSGFGITPAWIDHLLDPEILTIGFARRVPTYKRLTLMLRDQDRLRRLLTHPTHPVQIVVAGKSHPADDQGKQLIQQLVRFSKEEDVRERIVFLPDYDMTMAKKLYPGCDVWLNNPLRPLEACGTSGMKAAMNGVLNLSVLDGWWNEKYGPDYGWAIPTADHEMSAEERDDAEANALYDLIEHQLAPKFYDRHNGPPKEWIRMVRATLTTLCPDLSALRMVREYTQELYAPAATRSRALATGDYRQARELSSYLERVRGAWDGVAVSHVESGGVGPSPHTGDTLQVRALVQLGELSPDDVRVEVVYGAAGEDDDLTDVTTKRLRLEARPQSEGEPYRFTGSVPLSRSGGFGYNVRVLPEHPMLANPITVGLVSINQG